MTKPRQPGGLGAAGKRLWLAITAGYDDPERGPLLFSPAELVVLEHACHQVDDIAELERLLRREGLVGVGSAGQPKLTQVVAEVRQARLALARLLDRLDLPDVADGLVPSSKQRSPASRRAAHAATVRWDRERRRQEGA